MINSVDWNSLNKNSSRSHIVEEFKKYDGTPVQFACEFDKRFSWSGAMCQMVEEWCQAELEGEK